MRYLVLVLVLPVVVLVEAVGAQEGPEPIARVAESRPEGVGKADGRKSSREAPSRMVLCRGPRGAVYARDAKVGCRNTVLSPENLVDFGAVEERGCSVHARPLEALERKGPANCQEVCRAAQGARCVVALRVSADDLWQPSSPTAAFGEEEEVLSVCCRR